MTTVTLTRGAETFTGLILGLLVNGPQVVLSDLRAFDFLAAFPPESCGNAVAIAPDKEVNSS